jgi:hypothetical protein
MSWARQRNAILTLALAGVFYFFFMFTKHDPAVSAVNSFAEDPFDAVGSFGIQAAAFLALLSLVRSFWQFRAFPSGQRGMFEVRTQLAAILAVLVTIAGDLVGMARSPRLWLHSAAGNELCALVGSMLLLASVLAWVVLRGWVEKPPLPGPWKRALAICVGIAVVLFLYPEALHRGVLGALFTAVVGTAALFLSMRALVVALVPYGGSGKPERRKTFGHSWRKQLRRQKLVIVVLGFVLGLGLVAAEFAGAGGLPRFSKLAFVGSVYVGLETVGLLIGYELLKGPLGLFNPEFPC